jgi:hypothetical protein
MKRLQMVDLDKKAIRRKLEAAIGDAHQILTAESQAARRMLYNCSVAPRLSSPPCRSGKG